MLGMPIICVMTDSEIIDLLGGTGAVAELCEVRPPSVSEWRHKGIPRARLKFLRAVRPDVFGAEQRPAPIEAVGDVA